MLEPPRDRRQQQLSLVCRAFALEDLNLQLPIDQCRCEQAQWRWRRVVPGRHGPANEDWALAALGEHLQAPELLRPGLWEPGQDGTGGVGAQQLLRAPEPLRGRLGLYPDELGLLDAEVAQAGKMRALGRTNDNHRAPALDELAKRRADEAPFQQRGLRLQDFNEAAAGPTSIRQLGVQGLKAGGHHGRSGMPELVAAPQGVSEFGRQPAMRRGSVLTRRKQVWRRRLRGARRGLRSWRLGKAPPGRQNGARRCGDEHGIAADTVVLYSTRKARTRPATMAR